jgi:membrane-bound lytic murein transglycosylase D
VRVQRALEKTSGDNFWTLADKRALPRETINYVPNILALTIIGKNPAKYGFNVASAPAMETERVSVEKATDLRVIADAIDLPVEDLRALNSHVLRWTTPPDDPDFQLILPKGYGDKFNERISSLPESKRILFQEHVVRKGDTLAGIARKYGTTVAQVSQANNFGKKPVLRVGESLVIPLSGVTPSQLAAMTPKSGTAVTTASAPTAAIKVAATKPAAPASTSSSAKSVFYTVRSGDTLFKIAAHFNTTVERLKAWNHLTSTSLAVGKRLLVSQPSATGPKTVANPGKAVHELADSH